MPAHHQLGLFFGSQAFDISHGFCLGGHDLHHAAYGAELLCQLGNQRGALLIYARPQRCDFLGNILVTAHQWLAHGIWDGLFA